MRIVDYKAGKQGTCFVLEEVPGRERVVLKAMSPSRERNSPESVEREYQALERFYEASRAHPGVGAPEPLALFKEQLGYLMSYVDAPSLEGLLESDLLNAGEVRVVAERMVCALGLYYQSVGEMYGDFHPLNVLVRPSLQVVLIDPSPTNPYQESVGRDNQYAPMSTDLGYWTYSVTARSVKQILKGSKLPARLYEVTSEIIACASGSYSDDDTGDFANAVYQVANRYMARLRTERRLRTKVLVPLAVRRLRALEAHSRRAVMARRGVRRYSHPAP